MRTAEELRFLILACQREGNRMLAAELKPLGVTPSQAEVIRVLGDHGPLTLNAVGELLVCETGTNPSRLVDRMVGRGLVAREPDAEDRRSVSLSLTGDGRRLNRRISTLESRFYALLEGALEGQPVEAALATLRTLAGELPAGQAVARRAELAGSG